MKLSYIPISCDSIFFLLNQFDFDDRGWSSYHYHFGLVDPSVAIKRQRTIAKYQQRKEKQDKIITIWNRKIKFGIEIDRFLVACYFFFFDGKYDIGQKIHNVNIIFISTYRLYNVGIENKLILLNAIFCVIFETIRRIYPYTQLELEFWILFQNSVCFLLYMFIFTSYFILLILDVLVAYTART